MYSNLLFRHSGICMLTIPIKKLQLHTLLKLHTSPLPQLQQFHFLSLQTGKLKGEQSNIKKHILHTVLRAFHKEKG